MEKSYGEGACIDRGEARYLPLGGICFLMHDKRFEKQIDAARIELRRAHLAS